MPDKIDFQKILESAGFPFKQKIAPVLKLPPSELDKAQQTEVYKLHQREEIPALPTANAEKHRESKKEHAPGYYKSGDVGSYTRFALSDNPDTDYNSPYLAANQEGVTIEPRLSSKDKEKFLTIYIKDSKGKELQQFTYPLKEDNTVFYVEANPAGTTLDLTKLNCVGVNSFRIKMLSPATVLVGEPTNNVKVEMLHDFYKSMNNLKYIDKPPRNVESKTPFGGNTSADISFDANVSVSIPQTIQVNDTRHEFKNHITACSDKKEVSVELKPNDDKIMDKLSKAERDLIPAKTQPMGKGR